MGGCEPRLTPAGRALHDMRERGADDFDDVVVRERVHDVTALTPAHEQMFRAQNAQALRHGGDLAALCSGKFGHAARAIGQPGEQAQAGLVADGAEEPRRAVNGIRVKGRGRWRATRAVPGAATGGLMRGAYRHGREHIITSAIVQVLWFHGAPR